MMLSKEEEYIQELRDTFHFIVNVERIKECSFFVSGATGLIGSAVSEVLLQAKKDGNNFISLFLAGRSIEHLNERFCKWKGLFTPIEYEAANELKYDMSVDYVIHCAGISNPMLYATKPVEVITTSVYGTKNILEFAQKNNAKRVLYVSSSEVYGKKVGLELYKEADNEAVDMLNPRSCYPLSKRLCENLCICYGKEYGLDSVIVRPGHVYGPTFTKEDTRAHAQFLQDAIHGRDIIMKSEGLQLRSYCYVLDCVSAMLSVLINGQSWESYNISNKDSIVTIRDFADMHAKYSGKKVRFEKPSQLEESGYNMMTSSALDSNKLYDLGWRGRYNLEKGVASTISALKSKK
jgi:UDP-glucuronate decarboxylase